LVGQQEEKWGVLLNGFPSPKMTKFSGNMQNNKKILLLFIECGNEK